ncbi:ABC transporter permease [Lysinibacter cavernae]|uniref:Peptide/nickel transport system permease protein n=1 Tax=Lysinibacter cavernae TaxID=1640652 RepID=A0A7X5R327_9MICO|nr:ABC transporter permease [Lysinibacter cavernae]NIH54497.1 peptide/nickel transport system permease protein [Lysinibacter cavernae]
MGYIARRLGQAIIVLFIAFTGAFLLLQALPGDALLIKFENPELGLSQEQIAAVRETYGANIPLPVQFWHTFTGFLSGDFGYSVQSGTAVRVLLAEVLPATLLLAGVGFVVAVFVAVSIAFLSTFTRFAWIRGVLRSLPSLFVSVPVFWLGIILIQVFSFRLGLIPVINPSPVQALILPVLTLAVPISAPLAQILTRSIDDISTQPFIAVVTAKGASRSWVLFRNVAKNALLPTLTIAGILFGELIAGAVVTETVFGRAGLGRLTEQAVANQDTPVLMAVVLVAALVFVIVNLIVDLLYPVLDPRLKRKVGANA